MVAEFLRVGRIITCCKIHRGLFRLQSSMSDQNNSKLKKTIKGANPTSQIRLRSSTLQQRSLTSGQSLLLYSSTTSSSRPRTSCQSFIDIIVSYRIISISSWFKCNFRNSTRSTVSYNSGQCSVLLTVQLSYTNIRLILQLFIYVSIKHTHLEFISSSN